MEREVRLWLWIAISAGALFATILGLLADDPSMIQGAMVCWIGGVITAPIAARMWR